MQLGGGFYLSHCDKQKPPQKITKRFQTKKLPISSNYPSHSLEKQQCKGQAVKERRLRANLPCSNFHNKHKNAVSAMYCQFTMQCFSILARKSKLYSGSTKMIKLKCDWQRHTCTQRTAAVHQKHTYNHGHQQLRK